MSEITVLDENGNGVANVEFSNENGETATSGEDGKVELNGKSFYRNLNIAPATQPARCIQDFLPSEIRK